MENVQIVNLDNGLTLLLQEVKDFNTVSIGFYIKKGSMHEKSNEYGYAHFTEHMLFKGTNTRTYKQINDDFSIMGGAANAGTSYPHIVVYNVVPEYCLYQYLDIAVDMINNSVFDKDEFEKEKQVILNEMIMYQDSNDSCVDDEFMANLYHDTPLSHKIIGTQESIENVTRDNLYKFYLESFVVENMFVSIAGKFNSDEVIQYFSKLTFRHGTPTVTKKIKGTLGSQKIFTKVKQSEHLYLQFGNADFDIPLSDKFVFDLLNNVLGEGLSSRFYHIIREQLGLCYSIDSCSRLTTYWTRLEVALAIEEKNLNKALHAISDIIRDVKQNNITKEELERVQKSMLNEIILAHDSVTSKMRKMAAEYENLNRYLQLAEIENMIKSVTLDDIKRLIDKIFIKDNFIIQILNTKKVKCDGFDF